jgi:hypothetical protein
MALDRTRKSVIFHKGISDDADRFLLEPPAIDYAENLRIDKEGSFQKRPGFGPSALTTVPNADGDPFFIHAIQDNLHVLTEDGGRSYDGSWSETPVDGFIGTGAAEVSTPPAAGMGHVDILPVYEASVLTRYVVAYEVREESSSSNWLSIWRQTPKHVVVQTYDKDGVFLFQSRIDDAQSPKLLMSPRDNGAVRVHYQSLSDDILYRREYYPTDGTLEDPLESGTKAAPTFGMDCHGWVTSDQVMDFTRLGAKLDGHARYHVALVTDQNKTVTLVQYRVEFTW